MRDPNRIYPFCNELADLWLNYLPDWRFWQVICAVIGNMPSDYFKQDPFYAEEDVWKIAIEKTKEQLQNKT